MALTGHSVPGHVRTLLLTVPGFFTPEPVAHPAWVDVARSDVVVLYTAQPVEDLRSLTPPEGPGPPILVVTALQDADEGVRSLRMGATSYLIDGEFTRNQFFGALIGTERGESWVSPTVTTALVQTLHTRQPRSEGAPEGVSLTERELHLLRLLSEGCSNAVIAKRLFLAEKTVRNYLSRLYAKLDFGGRSEAIVWWMNQAGHRATELD